MDFKRPKILNVQEQVTVQEDNNNDELPFEIGEDSSSEEETGMSKPIRM